MSIELDSEEILLLKQHEVILVFLFGSRQTGAPQTPKSDLDIGIVFKDERARLRDAVSVYADLHALFQKKFPHEKIDLVYLRESPYELQFRAMTEGENFFAANKTALADYREEVMRRYFDFKPVEELFNRTFSGRS